MENSEDEIGGIVNDIYIFIYSTVRCISKARDCYRHTTDGYDVDDKLCPYTRGRMWPKFPDICLALEENSGKPSMRKLTRPGMQFGSAG